MFRNKDILQIPGHLPARRVSCYRAEIASGGQSDARPDRNCPGYAPGGQSDARPDQPPRGWILYFHGGGFLFGDRDDLPEGHLAAFLREEFSVLTFDYSLAPHADLTEILREARESVDWFLAEMDRGVFPAAPWFLWGRSAGAFLCLMTGLYSFPVKPAGILSWYGYGFLEDGWYDSPNPFYRRLAADAGAHSAPAPREVRDREPPAVSGPLHERFPLYALARAEGGWLSWIYKGRKKDFLRDCSLRDRPVPADYPPALLIHGVEDPDVPFAESQKLSNLLPRARLSPRITTRHDFDADPSSSAAKTCLQESIAFLLEQTPASIDL